MIKKTVEDLTKDAVQYLRMAHAQIDRPICYETKILNASYALGEFSAIETMLMETDTEAFALLHEKCREDWERVSKFLETIYHHRTEGEK